MFIFICSINEVNIYIDFLDKMHYYQFKFFYSFTYLENQIHPKKQKIRVMDLKIPNQSEEIKKKLIPRSMNKGSNAA